MAKEDISGSKISTNGGAFIMGNVHSKGDFIGRDKIDLQNNDQMASMQQLIIHLDELRVLLKKEKIDPDTAKVLMNEIQATKNLALEKRPVVELIKSRLKNIQIFLKNINNTLQSTESIFKVLFKAAKFVGLSLI
jgi:hypothetical protein